MKDVYPSIINRKNLQSRLSNEDIIILKGNNEIIRSKDTHFPFRQDSNFLYLTGINIPTCLSIITNNKSFLFIPPIEESYLIWNAPFISNKEIKKNYKFDFVYDTLSFEKILKNLTKNKKHCYTTLSLKAELKKLNSKLTFKVKEFDEILALQRSIKNKLELELMKKASLISSNAFIKTISSIKKGMYEYQIQSLFEKELHFNNILSTAFPSIVAAGTNSSILHYSLNSKKVKAGDLCLIDAGGEYKGYAADITRTVPINGKFSFRQKEIYEIVLNAQNSCINSLKSGISLNDIQKHCIDLIVDGLIKIKIFKNKKNDIIKHKSYMLFFPHGVSHLLGLDTHDVSPLIKKTNQTSSLRNNIILKEGMVLTIEPGIYFNPHVINNKEIQKKHKTTVNWEKVSKYINFGGIRIEDNLVITKNSCINLTKVPKTIQGIENINTFLQDE